MPWPGSIRRAGLSFGGVKDVRGSLKRLEVGSTLAPVNCWLSAPCWKITNRAKAYSRKENEDDRTDSLDSMFEVLQPLTPLSAEIRRCILSEEEIADDASPGLRQVRRSMKNANDKIHSQLTSIVNGGSRSYLQDAVITMRNGRYCIPVKAEHKGQVPGYDPLTSPPPAPLFL